MINSITQTASTIEPRLLETCLEDLERRINPEIEDQLSAAWQSFLENKFTGDLFIPARPVKSEQSVQWPAIRINACLEDFNSMVLNQFHSCSEMLRTGSGGFMCVRSNYGSSILPSLFGVEPFYMSDEANTLPTTRPLPDLNAVRRILDQGVPDLNAGFGSKTFEAARRLESVRKTYPKIGRYVHHYHPDLQGPLDVCEVLVGSEFFLHLVDEPGMMKDLLALVTETYIKFMKEWNTIVPFSGPYSTHWSLMFKGNIMLRNDSAMNISPEMYDEFVVKHDQRIFDEFGGGAFHFCGRGDHYIASAAELRGVSALAMSQPEYNNMETICKHTVDRGIKLISFNHTAAQRLLSAGRNLRHQVHC